MKKIVYTIAFMGLALGNMSAVYASSTLTGRIANIYQGAKNKVRETHASLLVDGMMRRVHNKMPSFLKGDSSMDSAARVLLLGSALYVGIKPLLKTDNDARKVLLGTLGWIFKLMGVENLTVQGENYAQLARAKQEELARDVQKTIEDFTGRTSAE